MGAYGWAGRCGSSLDISSRGASIQIKHYIGSGISRSSGAGGIVYGNAASWTSALSNKHSLEYIPRASAYDPGVGGHSFRIGSLIYFIYDFLIGENG